MTAPQPVFGYRALWPVLDEDRSVRSLIEEAREQLPDILRRSRVRAVGAIRWTVHDGDSVPGSGGAGLVLLAYVAVVEIPRNVDVVTGAVDRRHLKAVPA